MEPRSGATMADRDHLKRLQDDVNEWNLWRGRTNILPDLSGADLGGANLLGFDLAGANLIHVNLSHADLSECDLTLAQLVGASLVHAMLEGLSFKGANLTDADLTEAISTGADFSDARLVGANMFVAQLSGSCMVRADLSSADLAAADLSNSDLSIARLDWANLSEAILDQAVLRQAMMRGVRLDGTSLVGADLHEASFGDTIFADLNLRTVHGLKTSIHSGPSIIDHRTLEQSPGLPLEFLRGVGLPNNLIDYLPSLFQQAIQYYSCFISYSTKDHEFANRLHADLQNIGIRCWFAPHDMPVGGKILDEIDAAIRLRDKVLLIVSEHSIKSDWVEDEVKTAYEEERKRGQAILFPIRLDDAIMDTKEAWASKLRADRNIGDFRNWKDHDSYQKALGKVLRDLGVRTAV